MSAEALAKAGGRAGSYIDIDMEWTTTRTVYLIRSQRRPKQTYVGVTSSLDTRLADHNAGRSPHTSKCLPWELIIAIQFSDPSKANAFERYLKFGSGRAFANRHFW